MNAQKLYKKVDTDFEIEKLNDDWDGIDLGEFIFPEFMGKWMGLVLNNSQEIEKVYTAVFPSDKVINEILDSGDKNILLFTHHPMIWDATLPGSPFKNISPELLAKMKDKNISLYNLHVPLDKNGEYSTTVSLARALGIPQDEEFCEYFGVKCGVIGKTNFKTINELAEKVEKTVGHQIKIFNYGIAEAKNQKVGLVAGGGNDPGIIKELVRLGINTYVTGVTKINESYMPSVEFHKVAKENGINVVSATHYSTEKFACMAMVNYFEKLGLPTQFISDEAGLVDLG